MRHRAVFLLCAVLLAPPADRAQERAVVDDEGREFISDRAPARIVSLAPNITEILYRLGLDGEIAGVTRFCDYPAAALRKSRIGGMVDPSPEMIQALNPDLIIAFRGNPLRTIERLRSLGFPVFVLNIGNDIPSLLPMIEKIGRITGREKEALSLSAAIRSRLSALGNRLKPAKTEPKVFLALHGTGLWTCGRESYLNDFIFLCRARNVASSVGRKWIHYSIERLVGDDPEIIIILARSAGEFEKSRSAMASDPRYRSLSAVRTDRFVFLDENIVSRFGPRLIDALEEAAPKIHPELAGAFP